MTYKEQNGNGNSCHMDRRYMDDKRYVDRNTGHWSCGLQRLNEQESGLHEPYG